jgi:hypothetical protein
MSLHRYPTAAEAIEAVREFLTTEVVTGGTGETVFHARVAAHLLAIVERELAAERGDAWLAEQLATLGVADEDDLAGRVRDGLDRPDVVAVLTAITDERLRVANPAYLALVDDDDPRTARGSGPEDPGTGE